MQYDTSRAKSLFLWIAYYLGRASIPQIWPVMYLAERTHVAKCGFTLLRDTFVAMRDGPVPIRTFSELYLQVRGNRSFEGGQHVDHWLRQSASRFRPRELERRFSVQELQSMRAAMEIGMQLGYEELKNLVKGHAWHCAGPDGILDFLEMAREGNAEPSVEDFILRARPEPYLLEIGDSVAFG